MSKGLREVDVGFTSFTSLFAAMHTEVNVVIAG